jgi:hypothetical protein
MVTYRGLGMIVGDQGDFKFSFQGCPLDLIQWD